MKQDEEFNVITDINAKNKEKKKEKKKKSNKFFGILLVIWFFISFILMAYFSEINLHYSIMIFGQLMFVVGIFVLNANDGNDKLLGIPFILAGIIIVVVPYVIMNPEFLEIEINWGKIGPFIGVSSFVLGGLALLILPILIKNNLKKKCIESVNAIISGYDITYSNKKEMYSPIYTFKYYGKEYNVSNDLYASNKNKRMPLGTEVEIKINPDNPEQFLDESKSTAFIYIFGIIFLIPSVLTLLWMLKEYQIIK